MTIAQAALVGILCAATPWGGGLSVTPAQAASARPRAKPAAVSVITLAGLQTTLRQKTGKVVLLHLWATWCEPCLHELPMIADAARRLRERNVEVVSVSLDPIAPRALREVARVIKTQARGQLTGMVLELDDADAFVAAIDPRWEGSIPALFGYYRNGALGGALLGESSRAEIDSLVTQLEQDPPATRQP